jgi:hypothetical protein
MTNHYLTKYQTQVFWNDEYKHLNYVNEEFNDSESLTVWTGQGYPNKFTGDMCDMRSPQPSWNHVFVKIYEELGWKNIGTSYYRMNTGTVLPMHQDTYKRYIELFDLQGQEHTIRRAIVFLEDWATGHYFDSVNGPLVNWRAGTTVEWPYDTPHMAANIGLTPRYTLQITGHL